MQEVPATVTPATPGGGGGGEEELEKGEEGVEKERSYRHYGLSAEYCFACSLKTRAISFIIRVQLSKSGNQH